MNSNCWHLARDAWLELTGVDVGDRTPGRPTADALMHVFDTDVPAFEKLDGPADPSLVLMRRRGVVPHVGVYYRGRILQITPGGASYVAPKIATMGFETVEYYR